jgi:hypothetical protein
MRQVHAKPVKECAYGVYEDTLHLYQGETEIVLVMAVNPVQIFIAHVFVEGRVYQDLARSDEQHEEVIVETGVRELSGEATLDHV